MSVHTARCDAEAADERREVAIPAPPFAIRRFAFDDLHRIPLGEAESERATLDELTAVSPAPGVRIVGWTALDAEGAPQGCLCAVRMVDDAGPYWCAWGVVSDVMRRHRRWLASAAILGVDALSKEIDTSTLWALIAEDNAPAQRLAAWTGFRPTDQHWRPAFDRPIYTLWRFDRR